jgi:phospholipid/cholesterol/gamma-HCH transport system permease protein
VKTVKIDAKQLTAWDSGLLTFLVGLERHCRDKGISLVRDGLPAGVQRLLTLALAVPERKDARRSAERKGLLTSVGERVIALGKGSLSTLAFVGEAMIALGRFARGRARFRGSDLVLTLQQCGAQAFPIVSLISFLVGLILAFVGAVQLRQFGAQIYVADLVGIAMVREMGAIMTGIVMAGRTGAAFAAQLGTMQVNEEIDALTTLGLSPMEFLVLPRMLALALMMPLLCVYADLMGMVGGLLIGVGMLDLGFLQYVQQTREAISLTNVSIGLAKASIFGVLVAVSGCLHGIRSGRSASAVGSAATSAVVTGIVAIIVCDAIFAVILEVIGI